MTKEEIDKHIGDVREELVVTQILVSHGLKPKPETLQLQALIARIDELEQDLVDLRRI